MLVALKQQKCIYNSGGRRSKIRMLAEAVLSAGAPEETVPYLQLLEAPGISWPIVASLQFCLHLHIALFSSPCVSYKDTYHWIIGR